MHIHQKCPEFCRALEQPSLTNTMNTNEPISPQESKPRFEFRSFGQNFDNAVKRMARLSIPVPEEIWERNSDEIYILSRTNDMNSVKIRNGRIDIKTFTGIIDEFEEWNPILKVEFPLTNELLGSSVFPALQVYLPERIRHIYTFDDFIGMIRRQPDLQVIRVHKQRFAYLVNNTICETGVILINGARVVTISVESTEINDIRKTIRDIGLDGVENINYLQAIKRVIGMIDKPLAN